MSLRKVVAARMKISNYFLFFQEFELVSEENEHGEDDGKDSQSNADVQIKTVLGTGIERTYSSLELERRVRAGFRHEYVSMRMVR